MTPTRSSRPRFALAGLALMLAACTSEPTAPPDACPTGAPNAAQAATVLDGVESATVTTNKGEFTIDLDITTAPVAAANLVRLVDCGFYDGLTFHRVIAGFVIQTGDPGTRENRGDFAGLGAGSPGYRFEVEFPPEDHQYEQYMVAMANAIPYDPVTGEITGPTDSNGSQFFVMLADAPQLRPYYSPLGAIGSGTDVVDEIGQVPTSGPPTDVPLDAVIIESIRIQRAAEAT